MNQIAITTTVFPIMEWCNFCVAREPFYHVDRIAPYHVCILVTSGAICVTEVSPGDGTETDYEIREGELLFLKSGCRHYGRKQIEKDTSWYYIHFRCPEPILPNAENMTLMSYSDSQSDALSDTNPLSALLPAPFADVPFSEPVPLRYYLTLPKYLTGLAESTVQQKLHELTVSFHSTAPDRCMRLNTQLYDFLLETENFAHRQNTVVTLADQIALYLKQHLAEPFQAGNLEKHFFLSYKYMAAIFKKEKKVTMQQYHTALRMQEACVLLKTTSRPIGEIAGALGYQDELYFSRCFHGHMGTSPSRYRRQLSLLY